MGRLYGSPKTEKKTTGGGRLQQAAPHLFQYDAAAEYQKLSQQRSELAQQEARQARVQQVQTPPQSDFLKQPVWRQILSRQTLSEIPNTVMSGVGRLFNGIKSLKNPDELLKKASLVAGGTIETAKNLTIPYAEKKYTSAVEQHNALTDKILKQYRSEQDPLKKKKLKSLLQQQISSTPQATDFSSAINKNTGQIAADTAMAGLEWVLPFVGGAAVEGATKAAPLLTRPLGEVLKGGVAKLATKEGIAALAKPIASEAGYGALYGGLGAVQQGDTKVGQIAKESAKMAAIAPVLAGVLKLGTRGASEVLSNIDKSIIQKPLRSITAEDLKSITRTVDEATRKVPEVKAEPVMPKEVAPRIEEKPVDVKLRQANRPVNEANTKTVVADTIAGKREDLRLDNPKALQNAKDYGVVHNNATPDTTVPVYRVGKPGSKIKPGDHVVLSESAAKARYLGQREGGQVINDAVPLKNLVKGQGLGDEFILAPKAQEVSRGTTPSKIAKSIEAKAVEKGLTKGFTDVAGYDKITIKEQAHKAAAIMQDLERAKRIIRGQEELPRDLKGTALVTAAEEHIKKNGDAQMAYDLANSPLVSQTSQAAQELRLAAEREPDSAAAKILEIRKAREDAATKRFGDLKKAKKKVADELKKEIRKAAPKVDEWSSFLNEIKCT